MREASFAREGGSKLPHSKGFAAPPKICSINRVHLEREE
jgi:hypothetical protein